MKLAVRTRLLLRRLAGIVGAQIRTGVVPLGLLLRADGLRGGPLGLVGWRTGKHAKLGELELEADIAELVDGRLAKGGSTSRRGWAGASRRHGRHLLLVLIKLSGQARNLAAQSSVFGAGGIRNLLQLVDLCLEVLDMLFLPLPESTLCSAVLSLSLLYDVLAVW
jgi:hypothetical protein